MVYRYGALRPVSGCAIASMMLVALFACADGPTGPARTEASLTSTSPSLVTSSGPTLNTDKADYNPGDVVVVTGTGWEPSETVTLAFEKMGELNAPRTHLAVADSLGEIVNRDFVVQRDDTSGVFTLRATGGSSGWTAQATFTDASVSFTPNRGPIAGGTTVVINGFGVPSFTASSQYTAQFGSTSPVSATYIDPTHLRVTSPPASNSSSVSLVVREVSCAGCAAVVYGSASFAYYGTPTRLVFEGVSFNQQVNVCSTAMIARAQDASARDANPASDLTVFPTTTSLGGAFYADATCLTPVSSVVIPSTDFKTAPFYYKDTAVSSSITLTISAPGLSSYSFSGVRVAGPPTQLRVTAPSTAAGVCAIGHVQLLDAAGVSVSAPAPVFVNLASSAEAVFYADGNCGTAKSTLTISGGLSSVPFYYRSTVVGQPTITATAQGLTAGSSIGSIIPGVSTLVFANPQRSVFPNVCTSLLVQGQNSDGTQVQFPSPTTVTLTSSTSTGSFYTASTCTGSTLSQVVISANSSGMTVWYKDATPGVQTVGAAAANLASASQSLTIFPPISALTFTNPVRSVAPNGCASLTIQGTNSLGTILAFSASATISLASTSGVGQFFANTACSGTPVTSVIIAAGNSAIFVGYRDATVGTPTVTASAPNLASATQAVTVGTPIVATTTAISTQPAAPIYGQSVVVTATVSAASGSPGGTVTFKEGGTCADPASGSPVGGAVTLTSGKASVSTATLGARSHVVTACYSGATGYGSSSGTREVVVQPATLTALAENQQRAYGATNPLLTVRYQGFVLNETESVVSGQAGLSTTATQQSGAGAYPLVWSSQSLAAANYTISYTSGTLTVTPAPLTIRARDEQKVFDGLPFRSFTVGYDGFVLGEDASALAGSLTFSAAQAVAVNADPGHANMPGGLNSSNYKITYVAGRLRILPWTLAGFYQPVAMSTGALVYNTVKAGATVPLKFNAYQAVTAGVNEQTDISAVLGFSTTRITCANGVLDAVDEFSTTGNTTLRYDTVAGQFIQNWKTPKAPNTCYTVTVTTADGSKLQAIFMLN